MAHPARPDQPPRYEPYQTPLITKVGTSMAFGYLATKIFTSINPIAGAIFTGTWSVLDSLFSRIDNVFRGFLHSTDAKYFKFVLSGAISYVVTNQFMKITLMEGIKLTALPIFTVAAVILGIAGIIVIIGTVGGLINLQRRA